MWHFARLNPCLGAHRRPYICLHEYHDHVRLSVCPFKTLLFALPKLPSNFLSPGRNPGPFKSILPLCPSPGPLQFTIPGPLQIPTCSPRPPQFFSSQISPLHSACSLVSRTEAPSIFLSAGGTQVQEKICSRCSPHPGPLNFPYISGPLQLPIFIPRPPHCLS